MPVEAKPLFRPDVLRPRLAGFDLPGDMRGMRETFGRWAELLWSSQADTLKEQELLPDFLTDVFCGILGYNRAVDNKDRYSFSREKHVQVDGKYADAVLGELTPSYQRFLVAVEGKGPKDPLDRPFLGRKMSAVDQGYRYAINLPCDWIIVTSMRQTRLYYKGSDQYTYERFDTDAIVHEESQLRRFVFLLGARRVVPAAGRCHLYELLSASEKVGRELTKEFYVRYAGMREDAFEHLRRANPSASPHQVLASTQKLLDRILFCAFCEDRGLLPAETIHKAYEHNDPYNPRPVWENFRGLFRAINTGNTALNIPAYNGYVLNLATRGIAVQSNAKDATIPEWSCFAALDPPPRPCGSCRHQRFAVAIDHGNKHGICLLSEYVQPFATDRPRGWGLGWRLQRR